MPSRLPVFSFAFVGGALGVMSFGVFPAFSADHRVTMAGAAYTPAMIMADVGDTLVFVNDSDTAHAVFVPTKGFAVSLGGQKPGQKKSLALRRSGQFEVECVHHASMLLTVTVRPNKHMEKRQ